jgi:hypothetical protein
MIAKLQHPATAATVGLVLSIGVGVGLSWRTLSTVVITRPHAAASEPTEAKRKGWDFWTIEIENLSNELKEEKTAAEEAGGNPRPARGAARQRGEGICEASDRYRRHAEADCRPRDRDCRG